ncbi:hypothetical protein CEXT_91951 [Caerostris extrusa]|uniref:Uncharacterized protein n=1 Tax=Caerostris extrusa TaxID=172846 RepID=A0AAV4XFA4_CAEEX|nr:hypothetical protein CEXT_91951 [Caerostris extrusa]
MYRLGPHQSHLGNEHQAERRSGAEHDEDGDDDEGGVLLLPQHEGQGRADHAHDHHVVDAHADVLGVVQGRDADVPCLPGQKTTEGLQKKRQTLINYLNHSINTLLQHVKSELVAISHYLKATVQSRSTFS